MCCHNEERLADCLAFKILFNSASIQGQISILFQFKFDHGLSINNKPDAADCLELCQEKTVVSLSKKLHTPCPVGSRNRFESISVSL